MTTSIKPAWETALRRRIKLPRHYTANDSASVLLRLSALGFFAAAIAFAALLLIIPGFATDIIGFLIILPITRKLILGKVSTKIKKKKSNKNNFIDGEFEDIEDDDERKI